MHYSLYTYNCMCVHVCFFKRLERKKRNSHKYLAMIPSRIGHVICFFLVFILFIIFLQRFSSYFSFIFFRALNFCFCLSFFHQHFHNKHIIGWPDRNKSCISLYLILRARKRKDFQFESSWAVRILEILLLAEWAVRQVMACEV